MDNDPPGVCAGVPHGHLGLMQKLVSDEPCDSCGHPVTAHEALAVMAAEAGRDFELPYGLVPCRVETCECVGIWSEPLGGLPALTPDEVLILMGYVG